MRYLGGEHEKFESRKEDVVGKCLFIYFPSCMVFCSDDFTFQFLQIDKYEDRTMIPKCLMKLNNN